MFLGYFDHRNNVPRTLVPRNLVPQHLDVQHRNLVPPEPCSPGTLMFNIGTLFPGTLFPRHLDVQRRNFVPQNLIQGSGGTKFRGSKSQILELWPMHQDNMSWSLS